MRTARDPRPAPGRAGRAWTVALLAVVLCSACATPTTSATTASATASASASAIDPSTPATAPASSGGSETWSLVALGDSVPAGTACGCTPYPQLSAHGLTDPGVREVNATDDAVAGYTTQDVLTQLTDDTTVIDHVRAADVVELEIGANDVAWTDTCGTDAACYRPALEVADANLAQIVARVEALTSGHLRLLVLLDYWSAWLGGTYAQAKGSAYVEAAATVTDELNTSIKAQAARDGAAYVDLRAAFKGPEYADDETPYLAEDGDHPNAAGHVKIADTVVGVVQTRLHLAP